MKLLNFTNFFKFATSDFLRPAFSSFRNGGTKTIPELISKTTLNALPYPKPSKMKKITNH